VLRKLAKKYSLKKTGLEKPYIYVKDLIEVLRTNLITTKKRYSYRRYRILLQLYLQLGGFTIN
jgi:hemerythrin superfamily protein